MNVLEIVLPVLVMIVVGMLCRKWKILTRDGINNMKVLVTNVIVQYHVELWKYGGKSAKQVTSRISWSGNNMPYFGGLGICKYNGKYLLELTGNACGDNYYYGTKKDGSVGLVHKFIWKGDAMEGDWYMDGKKTSGNMYETYYKKYHANATWYSFAQSSNNNLIRKELSNTKQKLGM